MLLLSSLKYSRNKSYPEVVYAYFFTYLPTLHLNLHKRDQMRLFSFLVTVKHLHLPSSQFANRITAII